MCQWMGGSGALRVEASGIGGQEAVAPGGGIFRSTDASTRGEMVQREGT